MFGCYPKINGFLLKLYKAGEAKGEGIKAS